MRAKSERDARVKSGVLDSWDGGGGGDKLRRINAIYRLEMFLREMRKKGMREKDATANAGRIKKNRERTSWKKGGRKKGGTEGSRPRRIRCRVIFLLSSGREISLFIRIKKRKRSRLRD